MTFALAWGRGTASAPGNLSGLLDDSLARLPRVQVMVAQIIPVRRGPAPPHCGKATFGLTGGVKVKGQLHELP